MDRCVYFIVHHYNEIDHRTPIIYKWSKISDIPAHVIICSTPELINDYRIQFLDRLPGVKVEHISSIGKGSNGERIEKGSLTASVIDKMEGIGRKLPEWFPKEQFWEYTFSPLAAQTKSTVLEEMISNTVEPVVIFDWSRQPVSKNLLDGTPIPSACFPHGDSPYFNAIFSDRNMKNLLSPRSTMLSSSFRNINDNRQFRQILHKWVYHQDENLDWIQNVIVPNELTGERWEKVVPRDHLHVLGSPRFNEEWLIKLDEIKPSTPNFPEGEWNLVLFSRDPGFFVSKDRLTNTIEIIDRYPNIKLIVKEHTSGELYRDSTFNPSKLSNVTFVGREVHSPNLFDWGDLFLHAGTSVIFEAIMKDKPVISLDYVHANRSTTGMFLPDTRADTYDDLIRILSAIFSGQLTRTYTTKQKENFVEEMIELPDQNVLDAYTNFIKKLFARNDKSKARI